VATSRPASFCSSRSPRSRRRQSSSGGPEAAIGAAAAAAGVGVEQGAKGELGGGPEAAIRAAAAAGVGVEQGSGARARRLWAVWRPVGASEENGCAVPAARERALD